LFPVGEVFSYQYYVSTDPFVTDIYEDMEKKISGDSLVTVFLGFLNPNPLKSLINNGGGGGNRTRVREPSGRSSTEIAIPWSLTFHEPVCKKT